MLRRFAIILALALLVALPATAQDFQKGLAAAQRGDYATALKEWRPLLSRGMPVPKTTSGSCTPKAKACHKTFWQP